MNHTFLIGASPSLTGRSHHLWNYLYKHLGIDCKMLPIDAPSYLEFKDSLQKIVNSSSFLGGCITNPWKLLPGFTDQVDLSFASRHQSYNVLAPAKSSIHRFSAYNTDSFGFWSSINPYLSDAKLLIILGFGGTAKSIISDSINYDLSIKVLSRSEISSDEQSFFSSSNVEFISQENLSDFFDNNQAACPYVLVNATDCGSLVKPKEVHIYLDLILQYLPRPSLLFDVIHTPKLTSSMITCQDIGIPTLGGSHMNTLQAIRAFSLVHPDIPLDVVTSTMHKAISAINL